MEHTHFFLWNYDGGLLSLPEMGSECIYLSNLRKHDHVGLIEALATIIAKRTLVYVSTIANNYRKIIV